MNPSRLPFIFQRSQLDRMDNVNFTKKYSQNLRLKTTHCIFPRSFWWGENLGRAERERERRQRRGTVQQIKTAELCINRRNVRVIYKRASKKHLYLSMCSTFRSITSFNKSTFHSLPSISSCLPWLIPYVLVISIHEMHVLELQKSHNLINI